MMKLSGTSIELAMVETCLNRGRTRLCPDARSVLVHLTFVHPIQPPRSCGAKSRCHLGDMEKRSAQTWAKGMTGHPVQLAQGRMLYLKKDPGAHESNSWPMPRRELELCGVRGRRREFTLQRGAGEYSRVGIPW
jgi:hypothetical protein